jgi:hypothetical protein
VATAISELTYVSFPITKFSKDENGDLIVTGKATDGSVDSDEQIVDSAWSAKALSDWIDTGGNLRVQHQAMRDPAGKGLSVEIDRDGDGGHWVKSLVVEPVAKRLVEKGVLTAYSVGIARPVITRDPTGKARGGIVTGGSLAELSLVDRPANKNCGLMIGKAAAGDRGDLELVGELFGDAEFLAKAASEDDLLAKTAGRAADETTLEDPVAQDDAAEDDGNPGGETGDGSLADDDVSKAVEDLIATASEETRLAYKSARAEWLTREPSVKGIAGGTEYLAKRADWMKWDSEGEIEGLAGTREAAERWLSKRDFSAGERRSAADSGAAMPDGSFPIKNAGDLDNAIHLAGHAKDPGAARAHIKRRASALGLSDKIPDTWKAVSVEELAELLGENAGGLAKVMLGFDVFAEKAAKPDAGDDGKPCGTCKGDGKIKGGNVKCPACKGSGKMTVASKDAGETEIGKSASACQDCGAEHDALAKFCVACGCKLSGKDKAARKAEKAARREAAMAALAETVIKSVAAGAISQQAGDEIIAQAVTEMAARKGKSPLPASAAPLPAHREPDGTSTVERLEPDAGLPTDPDPIADKVPASVKSEPAPYTIGRMHDVLCAAYDPAEAIGGYPALKSVSDAVDEPWFATQASGAAAAGKSKKAARLAALVEAAQYIKGADPAAIADGHAFLRKAFTDMYPNLHISPKDGVRPGSYQRPYLTAGHAAENSAHNGSPSIPPSAHTIAPEDFHRPLITDGHAEESPANKAGEPSNFANVQPVTSAARTYYSHAQRDAARTALASLHDHIAASFPDLCPMAASKSVMPPQLGAANVPQPATPPAAGGVPGVGKGTEVKVDISGSVVNGAELQQLIKDSIARHAARSTASLAPVVPAPVMTRKRLEKAASRMGLMVTDRPAAQSPAPAGLSAEDMKTLLIEQITPLAQQYETQIDDLRKQVDEIGARPDPALAPVRGALAKVPDGVAVPVERRSLVDEAAETAHKMAASQEAQYRAYVDALAKSPDPGVREAALATLDKLSAGSPAGVAG